MRVIIWGINYAPEPTGIAPYTTELAEHLQSQGLRVDVLAGFPYYPAWRKDPGDAGRIYRSEKVGAVTVHRCWQYVPVRISALRRMVHELSFGVSSLLRALVLPRADLYVVISPPLGLGIVAWLVTRLKRSRYLFHVQDLQPDSAAGLGMVRAGIFLRLMYACERFAYRGAAGVSGISPGMIDAFAAKGVPSGKIFLLPNWLRQPPAGVPETVTPAEFRKTHGVPADAFLAVYSGNLGKKQGLDALLDAAEILEKERDRPARKIVLIIAGDGAGQFAIAGRLKERPLDNIRLLPLQPAEAYRAMLRAADVALVTQMPGTGQVCFPSKLLSVLSAGLPVLTAADETSDLARAVGDGGFGRNVPAAAPEAMAAALGEMADRPSQLAEWRENTRWVGRFSPGVMLGRFEGVVRDLGGSNGGGLPRPLEPAPHRGNSQ